MKIISLVALIMVFSFFRINSCKAENTVTGSFLSFSVSNDVFFETDRYFTNGFQLDIYHPALHITLLDAIFIKEGNFSKVNYGISLIQNIYTPKDLKTSEIVINDRPYASYLLAGFNKAILYSVPKIKIKNTLFMGIIGKGSGGELVQNGIHSFLPNSYKAEGWDNQLATDICLDYYTSYEFGLYNHPNFDINISVEGYAGIPYTKFSGGPYIRYGVFDNYFGNFGLSKKVKYQYYIYGRASASLNIYDATFQGGLFSNSVHTTENINMLAGLFNAGLYFSAGSFALDFTAYLITPEFKDSGIHKWGKISIIAGL